MMKGNVLSRVLDSVHILAPLISAGINEARLLLGRRDLSGKDAPLGPDKKTGHEGGPLNVKVHPHLVKARA